MRSHLHTLAAAGPFVVALGLGLVVWACGFDNVTGAPTAPVHIRFAVLVTVAVASTFRRRAPLVALVLGAIALTADAVVGPSLAVWLIASDVLYAAALYGGSRLSRATVFGGALGSTATVCIVAYAADDARTVGFAALLLVAFVATPLWWGRSVRSYRRIADLERDRARALAAVADLDRAAAVAAERDRMARDLHDAVAAHLSAVTLQANAAGRLLDAQDSADPRLRATVDAIRRGAVEALAEMRSMIELLRAEVVESAHAAGGLDRLDLLVDSARAAGVPVECSIADGPALPTAVDLAVFRITQEALANVTRHAPGATTSVTVGRTPEDRLTLTVRSECTATPPTAGRPRTGDGLNNMRWRAEMVGGSFEAGPVDAGWQVRAVLPTADVDAQATAREAR